MDRRGFFRRAGAVVLASPSLTALFAACTRATSASTTTTPPTSTVSVSAKLSWDELATSLDGRLIRLGTPGYPVARLGYDPRFDDVRPRTQLTLPLVETTAPGQPTLVESRASTTAPSRPERERPGGHAHMAPPSVSAHPQAMRRACPQVQPADPARS